MKTIDTPQRLGALTEAVTRLADQTDPVPDPVWAEAARHYDEAVLAWLVLDIAVINLYNRINVSTRRRGHPRIATPMVTARATDFGEAGNDDRRPGSPKARGSTGDTRFRAHREA